MIIDFKRLRWKKEKLALYRVLWSTKMCDQGIA